MFLVHRFLQVVFLTAHVSAVVFQDCGSAYELRAVNIDGCGTRPPCFVTMGDTVPVSIEFLARNFKLRLQDGGQVVFLHHYESFEPSPSKLGKHKRCEVETVVCPVVTNAISSLTSIMSVPKSLALNQRGFLRWRVYNESGQQMLCYSVLVQTQSPLQKLLKKLQTSSSS